MREHDERDPYRDPILQQDPDQQRKKGEERLLFRRANVLSGGLLLYYACSPILSWIASLLILGLHLTLSDTALALWNFCLSTINAIIPLWVMFRLLRLPPSRIFPMERPKFRLTVAAVGCGFGATVVGSYLSSMVSALTQDVAGLTPTMPDMLPDPASEPVALLIRLASIVVIPAIFEELLFRGAVLQSLRRFGDRFAIVVSALLFALCHRNLVQGPNAFVLGLVMGYFAIRTGSLLPTMMFHFLNNGLASVLGALLMNSGPEFSAQANYLYFLFCVGMGLLGVGVMLFTSRQTGEMSGVLSVWRRWLIFLLAPLTILYLIVSVWGILTYFA